MAFCSTTLSLLLQVEGIRSIKLSLLDNNSSTESNFLNHQRRSVYTIKVLYTWYLFSWKSNSSLCKKPTSHVIFAL